MSSVFWSVLITLGVLYAGYVVLGLLGELFYRRERRLRGRQ